MTTTEEQPREAMAAQIEAKPFQREERYIVIKRKQLSEVREQHIRGLLAAMGAAPVDSVVVERDWPEYETVWQMIGNRVSPPLISDEMRNFASAFPNCDLGLYRNGEIVAGRPRYAEPETDKLFSAWLAARSFHSSEVAQPQSRYTNDAKAKEIYDSWSDQPGWVPWVEFGNSDMQEQARREASA